MPLVRVLAAFADTTINEVRRVDAIPRVGDEVDVNGESLKVRAVGRAEHGSGVDAFVHVTPITNGRRRECRLPLQHRRPSPV
jgi:hypothetical protein